MLDLGCCFFSLVKSSGFHTLHKILKILKIVFQALPQNVLTQQFWVRWKFILDENMYISKFSTQACLKQK